MRFLVIDDDPGILELVTVFLTESEDHEAVGAPSAKAALEAIADAEEPFDCFLVDIQMPGVDGIALTRLIRETPGYQNVPIVMLTAMQEKHYLDRAFSAGATDYVSKPFDFRDLARRLQTAQYLSIRKSMQQEQPVMAGEFKGMGGEPKEVRLAEPVRLAGVQSAVDYGEFENYVRQAQLRRQPDIVTIAIKISHIDKIYEEYTSDSFLSLVLDTAIVVQETLLQADGVFSYRGNGTYLCVLKKRAKDRRGALQKELNSKLAERQRKAGRTAPELLASNFVPLGRKSEMKALETLASAVDDVEHKYAALKDIFMAPRRLLRRQRLSNEQWHLEKRAYEILLTDTLIAPECDAWTSILRRREKAKVIP